MTSNDLSTGWRFWGAWGLAFLGFPIGGLAAIGLVGSVVIFPRTQVACGKGSSACG